MPIRSRAILFAALSIVAVACGGCASKCKQALVQCKYTCQRDFQLCQVKNTEAWYCQNQVGNCDTKCDADNSGCSSWQWPW
ncbi:MAG: hypothetical protein ACLQAT_02735 [Candidatus Binataceae bacterium]